jgi:hypothetical protein
MSVRDWVQERVLALRTTHADVRGFKVTVVNTRAEIETADVLARLDAALELIERHSPHHFRHMRRDFARILVQRYECRGAYFVAEHTCMVELTFVVNRAFSEAQVAATILHEGMHARLHRLGFPFDRAQAARQERFCRRAEVEFGLSVPNGRPIVERAMAALEGADEEVAPEIDKGVAARRIAEADLEALRVPGWVKRGIRGREG